MASSPQPQPARATAQKTITAPDYIVAAQKADAAALSEIEKNPIYGYIFEGDTDKEKRIANVVAYLTAGLQDGTAKSEDLDKRRQELAAMNASIQVLRKQLGSEQAKAITSKAYADFQKIVNETSTDVAQFQEELAPLCQLAELFSTYGVDGNIIDKLNQAKAQKQQREEREAVWWNDHNAEVSAFARSVAALEGQLATNQHKLAKAWIGRAGLEAAIANTEADLTERRAQLAEAQAKTLPVTATPDSDIAPINEEILDLQNIGGEKFKAAVTALRDHTEEALAKISVNFNEAVEGLSNAREAFINMDRNCGDATFALSVLQVAVGQAETTSRTVAESIIAKDSGATGDMAALDKMEREQRSDQVLNYTSSLTTFMKDVGVAVTSLRSGQAVIKTILRMNSMALESANTHKITGMANTADAVTITIGSIIEVCNRAASRALADGLSKMRELAEQGSARLVGGTYDALNQQNEQLGDFIESVTHLKDMTNEIRVNSIDALGKQFELVRNMQLESDKLSDATSESERASFAARAGLTEKKPEEAHPQERHGFRMGMRQ